MVSRQRLIMGGIGVAVVAASATLALEPWHAGMTPSQANAVRGAGPAEQMQTPTYVDEVTPPTPVQNEKIVQAVGEARSFARDGKYDEAVAVLQKAEKISKSAPQIGQAHDEIARLRTPEGRLASELVRARVAVDHGDRQAADKALAEIEKIEPDLPDLAELRAVLQQQQAKVDRRDRHIKDHLAAMREAMTRGDFAAAGGELNAAARIDVTDTSVLRARSELADAYEDARRKQARQ